MKHDLRFDPGWITVNSLLRLCQIVAATAVVVYYATPLRKAASEHKYIDGKFVYATTVGSASLATALSVLMIPPSKQSRAISVLFVWEWILDLLWLALFLIFRAFFHENPEMDSGIEKMKIAVYFDVASFILWFGSSCRSTYIFSAGISKQKKMFTINRHQSRR